ncbi:CGNR zinc finger domain-containing protein [Actinomadura alba]|uniref:CGNR zinc finger domain-containing protein n=1 Tax=Actinomadura alba TaxID=406431 RepID=A0ABR7LND8_9ACTN|nr:CGNR zinc finger domain-containing protein [Actinomadura alba]MBC6466245.1 CGNR zinc finger domain-containing protein [Actinomadura alba]
MQFNPYGGVAAQLAVAIVNAGPDAGPESFENIIRAYDYRPSCEVDPVEARELTRWAGRLREVFSEPAVERRVLLVNELLATVAAPPRISQHDGRAPHFHYADDDAPLVDRIKASTAAGLAHALCEDTHRIGLCARSHCDVVYIDTSRNGRRRFCSARCANRTHVADHRNRRKGGADGF